MKGMEDATFLEEETFIGCSSREHLHKGAYKKGVLKLLTLLFPELMIVLYGGSTFKSVDANLRCDHSIETSSAVLSHNAICMSVFYFWNF